MESLLKRIEKNRKEHERMIALVLCLSMLVSMGTFAAFHKTAVAKTYTKDVLDCPYAMEDAEAVAHVHNDDCYDGETLVCTLPELEAHTHTDECFAEQLKYVCGLEENPGHQHGAECYVPREVNICGLEENPGHEHTGTCFNESGVLICTMEAGEGAHTHTSDCFTTEWDLVCEIPEGEVAHTHTEDCYTIERTLICNKTELPVHVHDAGCIRTIEWTEGEDEPAETGLPVNTAPEMPVSDPYADLETAEDWERDFENLELSGNWARDLVRVAATQQGHGESLNNFEAILNDAGDAWVRHGYTRYGAWYGYPYAEWSAMFVSFCLRYAGIPAENVPNNPTSAFMAESFSMGELFAGRDYVPAVGDLVFFDTVVDDEIENIDHMGIVYYVDAENGIINTVEGDRVDIVTTFAYYLDDEQIVGYGILPQNPYFVPSEEEVQNEEIGGFIVMNMDDEEKNEETTDTAEAIVPAVPMPAQSWERTAGGIKVSVEAPEGAFPENTVIAVTPVNGSSLKNTVSDAVNGEVLEVQAVDITFFNAEGREIEPATAIRVTMTPAETEYAEEKANVVHVDIAQQTAELIEQAEGTETDNTEVVFDAEAFTIYAIVYTYQVHFEYEVDGQTYTSEVPGAQDMLLSEVLSGLNIVEAEELETFFAKISDVAVSDPDVILLMPVEGDWSIRPLKNSEEPASLTVTMQDGAMFSISVEATGVTEVSTEDETAVISTMNELFLPEDAVAKAEVLTEELSEAAIAAVQAVNELAEEVAEEPETTEETVEECIPDPAVSVTGETGYQVFEISLDNVNHEEYENGFRVSLSLPENIIGRDFRLFHIHDGQVDELELNTEGSELEDGAEMVSSVSFVTPSFSEFVLQYTVDFHYMLNGKTYDYSFIGGGAVSFRELVDTLHILEDEQIAEAYADADQFINNIENVTFSDETLMKVLPITEGITLGALKQKWDLEPEYSAELTQAQIEEMDSKVFYPVDWALVSLKAFDTDETLTVTMKTGESFTVAVTDAQIKKTVIDAKGDTWEITVTYGEDAQIPVGAELIVNEILPKDSTYETYLQDALTTAGISSQAEYARFFDISIWYNGEQVEPADSVLVSIKLADTPTGSEEGLKVVHFEEAGLQVMDLEKTVEDGTGMTEMQFTTESFSIYGVIVEPGPSGVNDLDGRTFTISREGRYLLGSTGDIGNQGNGATGFQKGSQSDAPVWKLEQVNGSTYNISTVIDGQTKYMNLTEHGNNRANASLSDTPQVFTVDAASGGYRLSALSNSRRYYLDEHNGTGGNGFAGYAGQSVNGILSFNFTPPVLENNSEYAVIIEHNGSYYCVQNDGSLMPVQYSVEDNVAYVSMANPVFWTYVQENGFWNLRIPTLAATFDYQDLPNNYYYRYIDPNVASGISEEPNVSTNSQYPTPKADEPGYGEVVAALRQQHTNYVQNCAMRPFEGNVIHGQTNYIGIDQATMKIKGNVSQGEAATVYFAQVERVPPSANLNNTVNHIDISIEGGASLDVPLAYGTYYYYVNDELRTLTVDSDMTLKLKVEHVNITPENMKSAEITAYSNRSGILNDAFYVTGYTQNHSNNISNSAQVRLEGSFKVADLEHTYSDYKLENGQWISLSSQEQAARSEDTLTAEELKARKDNRVYYTVTVKKELTFPWVYEYAEGQTAQLLDADHQPLSTTRMVNLSKSFDYWEEGSGSPNWEGANECPPVTWDRGRWSSGHIIWDTSEHAGTGMDFRLSADMNEQNADVVALEITKYLRKNTADGDALHPSATTPITNQFVVYEKAPSNQTDWDSVINVGIGQGDTLADYNNYSGIHGKSITVGSSGEGMVYDYDLSIDGNAVTAGMYYIKEDENSIPKIILAEDGTRWMYISTKVETEYVWRGYADNGKPRHSADGVTSIPEVAGLYGTYHNTATDKDEPLFNGFLTFFFYNVYSQTGYLKVNKAVTFNGVPLTANDPEANRTALAGTYTFTVYTDELCSEPYMVKKGIGENQQEVPLQLTIEILEDGQTKSSDLVELPLGDYWIKEETPTNDSVIPEENPLKVTITADNTTTQPAEVTFTNNKIESDNPDELAIELEKVFTGLPNTAKIPTDYQAALVYTLDGQTAEVPLTGTSHGNVTCTKSEDGMTWHWRVLQVPSAATDFGVLERNYDIAGYTRITEINDTEVENPGTAQVITVLKPTIQLTTVTNNYTTSDSKKVFEVTGNQILLVRLTKHGGGTMVVSPKSLAYATRLAIEDAIKNNNLPDVSAEWKEPIVYFSHEIQGNSYAFNGNTVYFEGDLVKIPHDASSHEMTYDVTITSTTAANSFVIENIYDETPVTVEILKIEEGHSDKPLEGAVFELRELKDVAPTTNGTLSYVTDNQDTVIVTSKTSGADGKLSFNGLTFGVYEIREVTPPPGYVLTGDIVAYLKVDAGTVVCLAKGEHTKPSEWIATSLSDPLHFTAATQENNALVTVGNTPGTALPMTGGIGTTLFTALGGLMTVTAGAILTITSHRRRRETVS